MASELNKLKSLLKDDVNEYHKTFTSILTSNVTLVDRIAKYIVKHKGKGLRPLIVLLSARMIGKPNQNTYIVAAAIELLHTATLVHDDVVDNADVRRRFPSINAIWKNKVSVLLGDYLLAKSLIGATNTGQLEVMNILAETSKRMSKGELLQIEKSRKLNITEREYFQMISDKTAALISACCELGVITVSENEKERQALKNYGENLGIAFQIVDDLLDYKGKQSIVGKPVGADLKENKITLPLILSLEKASGGEKRTIRNLLKKGASDKDVQRIIAFCENNGGIKAATEAIRKYADKAKNSILEMPESPYKTTALDFVEYVVNRKN